MNKCKVCQTDTINKHYCSMKCRDVSRKNESFTTSNCKTCLIEFSHRKYRNQKYCCSKCAANDIEVNVKKVELAKKTCISKYGVDSHTKTDDHKNKMKSIFMEKYGVDHYSKTEEYGEKFRKAMLDRYGVEYAQQNEDIKKKSLETAIKNFGGQGFASIETSEKIKSSIKDKYGFEFATQSDEVKETIKKTNLERYGVDTPLRDREKMLNSLNEKYGVTNISQTELHKNKSKLKLRQNFVNLLFDGDRLNGICTPMFDREAYIGSKHDNKYKFKCNKCESQFEDDLYSGNIPRCKVCFPIAKSELENEVFEYVKSLTSEEVIQGTRQIIPPYELDIHIPSKKLAIEFDGIYWHSESSGGKDRSYHLNKTLECEKLGIRLIHIFENEWINNQEIVKNKLKSILKMRDLKPIYARNCIIKEIPSKECINFLNKNHIQGSDKSSIKLGAFYNNTLVSVMTFGGARVALGTKNPTVGEYEMYRFCVGETSVIGIAGKFISHFIKNHNPSKITTFADIRYSGLNALYDKIGFTKVKQSPPNYWYFKSNNPYELKHRYNFRKSELSKKLITFDPNLTEWENMQLNGYDRIWDCGNLKYEWKKQP